MKKNIYTRIMVNVLFATLALGVMIVIAFFVHLPNSPYLDFRVLYFANKGILTGIPLYDYTSQAQMIAGLTDPLAKNLFVVPFPYAPWLALGTLYLGLLPIDTAMTFWLELNIVMLYVSVWLLTDEWSPRARLLSFPLAFLFLPVLGPLSVGQYDFPILLGASMLVYALRKENVGLGAAGAWLVIIKPHIGALIFLLVLAYLMNTGTDFGKRTVRAILISGVALFLISFAADPSWLVDYPRSLFAYREQSHIVSCSECSSLSVTLMRLQFDSPSLFQSAWISIPVFAVIASVFFSVRKVLKDHPDFLISAALLAVLLSSPYLYNYDFILLLVPFSILARTENGMTQVFIAICYLVPSIAIAVYGRAGNVSLLVLTVVAGCILYLRARNLSISISGRWQLSA